MQHRAGFLIIALALTACGRDASVPASGDPSAQANHATAAAVQSDPIPVTEGDPRIALAAKMPGAKPEDLRFTPVAGIFELVHDGEISYVTADGGYVFSGDLYQVTAAGDFPNLTDMRRRDLRLSLMSSLSEKDMIVIGPKDAPHTITVFTDVDCQWCRRLHSQVKEYNDLGIRVRYLAFPRSGPDTESWHKAESVWCARDRAAALTLAKEGGTVPEGHCKTPVASQYALGKEVGITGTPGVVFDTGELVPGYLAPNRMLRALEQSAADAAAAKPATG